MVDALRSDSVPYISNVPISGMYVVGQPLHDNSDIPSLPSICFNKVDLRTDSVLAVKSLSTCDQRAIQSDRLLDTFAIGDVVYLDGRSHRVRTLLSRKSTANTLLVTERCDNRCVFCSQPPNEKPDNELYVRAALALLNFNAIDYVGISGGEPTINGRSFQHLLRTLRDYGNKTKLHILSNGRRFFDQAFTAEMSALVADREVLWGIPLYAHRRELHNHLVAADCAFEETVQGLVNLGEQGQAIELRIVPTKANIDILPRIVQFVVTQLPHVKIFSIMNLEPKGWGRKNYREVYVPVRDQNERLLESIEVGLHGGAEVRLFNYPLCLLDTRLRKYSCKSISDWKNYFPKDCERCRLIDDCGGFFSSATGHFVENLEPLL